MSWAKPQRGNSIIKQQLSHWIVGAIALYYTVQARAFWCLWTYMPTLTVAWLHPGPFLKRSLFRTYVQQQAGPHHLLLFDSTRWTSLCGLHGFNVWIFAGTERAHLSAGVARYCISFLEKKGVSISHSETLK